MLLSVQSVSSVGGWACFSARSHRGRGEGRDKESAGRRIDCHIQVDRRQESLPGTRLLVLWRTATPSLEVALGLLCVVLPSLVSQASLARESFGRHLSWLNFSLLIYKSGVLDQELLVLLELFRIREFSVSFRGSFLYRI